MNRRRIIGMCATAALGMSLFAGSAIAQQKSVKEQLEVPPISWTPEHLCCRSPQWQEGAHLTRRSFGVR